MDSKKLFLRFIVAPIIVLVLLFLVIYVLEDGDINWLFFIPFIIVFMAINSIYFLIKKRKLN
ncbi:hypothetical protein A1A1_12027 [Planococcus antarcticus DSM 14505]|uniref:Uncharacterized protein n=1 Tax=Planococcus antarcticus DSM 14505 TaxID=1185653 RepID=A0A1C7DDB7_9BACL|nr:hypothetical protein [Planococcus antarcticus]ANU09510.1 hypothetical protein BBH88_03905 [Planococcus antarcticus DSM 14505]EIM06290.1 hypothetical protein A1A1_12027 [Planococcus antarcticus DSM 14505]